MQDFHPPFIVGNWKMHGSVSSAIALAGAIRRYGEQAPGNATVVVCPSFPHLVPVRDALGGKVALGAQDCHEKPEGAHTGDVSAQMLKDIGARFVILGHSERRTHHGETSGQARAKAKAALAAGLIPIICVGETLQEREAGRAKEVVEHQVTASVPEEEKPMILAYEPVWAIGSGLTPSGSDIAAMHACIQKTAPDGTPILYGGSVKAANAAEILEISGVAGVLVGGASLKPEEFCGIIAATTLMKAL